MLLPPAPPRSPLSLIVGLLMVTLGSCSTQPSRLTLSSGIQGGYYHRLGEQIDFVSRTATEVPVQNVVSQGSQQNLQNLLEGKTDFALVQLDVANEVMRQGKVQAVAVLANEPVHLITQAKSAINTLDDLDGKRVAIGVPGSGVRYTAEQIFRVYKLTVQADSSSLTDALKKLAAQQLDAVVYVGSLGASDPLRQELSTTQFRLISLPATLLNNLMIREPGSYRSAQIPTGTYNTRPPLPPQDLPTLATATVLVTRSNADPQRVGLLAWAILDNAHQFSQFYPELQTETPKPLLQRGLLYIHPAAQNVFEDGDPRSTLLRYWKGNNDLQAGVFLVLTSSAIGLALKLWRRQSSRKLLETTAKRIVELRATLAHDPNLALTGIEDLRHEHRLMIVEGAVSSEVFEQVQQKTQLFSDQCRTLLEKQRRQVVMNTLLLLDDWQETLQSHPIDAIAKLGQIKQQYREMLLANQIDIETYTELMELTLLSLITLKPDDRAKTGYSDRPHTQS